MGLATCVVLILATRPTLTYSLFHTWQVYSVLSLGLRPS